MGLGAMLRALWLPLRRHRWLVLVVLLGLAVDQAFDTAVRLSFKLLIDDVLVRRDGGLLVTILVALAAGALVVSAVAIGRGYLYARLSASVVNDLRRTAFAQLQRLSIDYFKRTPAEEVMARFTTDLAAVEGAVTTALPAAAVNALGGALAIASLFLVEWRLALPALLVIPASLLGPRLFAAPATRASYDKKRAQADVATLVHENLGAQAVVKAYGLEPKAVSGFEQALRVLRRLVVRAQFMGFLMERSPSIAVLVLNIALISTGSWLAYAGYTTVGAFVSFYVLFGSVSESILGATAAMPGLIDAAAGMQRLRELLDEQAQIVERPAAVELPLFARDLVLEDVTFGYGTRTILAGASLRIPQGQRVALVGPSGSGKSTVLSLLLRFHDPQQGRVMVDGHDLRDVALASLRRQVGMVFQESFLFNDSIRENIRLGNPDATPAGVEQAAKAAEIADLLDRGGRGDTTVGERGVKLSGGQRQRIAIARALVREPSILVLDEPTSALDSETEAAINDTLERASRGRTVVWVTHRLASVVTADLVYVLDQGRVVEQGTHTSLLAQDGIYAGLWRKQSGFVFDPVGEHAAVDPARLRGIPILGGLEPALLEELAREFVTEHHAKDRVVVHEGDPGDRFYVVVRGRVAVEKGDARRVAVLEDGDYFGEIALLKQVPRTATVRTLSPCVLLSLGRDKFSSLISRDRGVLASMEALLAERLLG
jgi:ATP-binding cassette subfamily B protein